jgi:hypothetical protein
LSSRQIVTCTQHFSFNKKLSFSRNATMSINHCTFSQQYSMLITHCILCRNLVFWKKYCMIERRLNSFLRGNCTSSERNTACLEEGSIYL